MRLNAPSRHDPSTLADATGWIALAFGLLFGAFVAAQLLARDGALIFRMHKD